MLVVAVVFLTIGGVSTAVYLSELFNDSDDDDDSYGTPFILCPAVSISLSKPPLILVYLHQKGESQFCETIMHNIIYNGFMYCFSGF